MFFCRPELLKPHFVRWLFDQLFRYNERDKAGNNHRSPRIHFKLELMPNHWISQLKNMRYVFLPALKLTSIILKLTMKSDTEVVRAAFLNMIAQASQAHVTSMLCKFTISQESGCCITSNRWDFVWEIKYWGLQMLNIIISTFFL